MNGLRNSNFQDNEIVKASDVQLVGDVSIENLGKAMKTLFGSTKSVVIGGKIKKYSGGSGLVAVLSPVIGIRGGEETVFVSEDGEFYPEDSVEPSSIITFPNSGTSARRDIVEVRAEVITTNEQSRQFYDPETESSSYSQTDVEQRQILRLKIKKGTNGSDTAPATDSGFVKIAEVLIPANATAIEDSNIYNVTADIEGIDNANWTNDKQITINPGTLSDISTKFRNIHNSNGTLKDSVIAASKIILSGTGALQGSGIQKGGNKETIDGKEVAATTSISDFIGKIVARLNKTWEPEHGGTGKTSLNDSANALINSLTVDTSDPTGGDYFVTQYAGGNNPKEGEDPKTTYYRKPISKLWNYIKGQISTDLKLTKGTDNKVTLSGTASAANNLSTARKLKVALGSTTDATFDGSQDQTSIPISGTLGLANGGTGATTACDARTCLGLGSAATYNCTSFMAASTTKICCSEQICNIASNDCNAFYPLTFLANTNYTNGCCSYNPLRISNGISVYNNSSVPANTQGTTYLQLGNANAKSVCYNSMGILRIYGSGTTYTQICAQTPTTSNTVCLPTGSGTLALTSGCVSCAGQVMISGTASTLGTAAKYDCGSFAAAYNSSTDCVKCSCYSCRLLDHGGCATVFCWSGAQSMPTWVWGSSARGTTCVYNPACFSVHCAEYASYAKSACTASVARCTQTLRLNGLGCSGTLEMPGSGYSVCFCICECKSDILNHHAVSLMATYSNAPAAMIGTEASNNWEYRVLGYNSVITCNQGALFNSFITPWIPGNLWCCIVNGSSNTFTGVLLSGFYVPNCWGCGSTTRNYVTSIVCCNNMGIGGLECLCCIKSYERLHHPLGIFYKSNGTISPIVEIRTC
ncbi:MAG: hypothetical protein MJZ37_01160 [Bacilli bacterium]|nr:hypothetical protein [Bacilli bacterium]